MAAKLYNYKVTRGLSTINKYSIQTHSVNCVLKYFGEGNFYKKIMLENNIFQTPPSCRILVINGEIFIFCLLPIQFLK